MNKNYYIPPITVRMVEFAPTSNLLAGSVVDNIPGVETGGQESGGFYDGPSFSHDWGD